MAGFNPFDVLIAIYMVLKQFKDGKAEVQNEYKRAVREEGNIKGPGTSRRSFLHYKQGVEGIS